MTEAQPMPTDTIKLEGDDRTIIGTVYPSTGMQCSDRSGSWGTCTRPKGHTGVHVAHVGPTTAMSIWSPADVD